MRSARPSCEIRGFRRIARERSCIRCLPRSEGRVVGGAVTARFLPAAAGSGQVPPCPPKENCDGRAGAGIGGAGRAGVFDGGLNVGAEQLRSFATLRMTTGREEGRWKRTAGPRSTSLRASSPLRGRRSRERAEEKAGRSGRDDSFSLRSGRWSYFGAAHVGHPNCFRNSRVCHAPVIPAVRAAVRKREL